MNRLKKLRIERGLLQSDIAKVINKGERTVGFYETGQRDMGTKTLAILSDFFNVTIDYLLGNSDVRNSKDIKLDDMEIAFANSIKQLNKKNQETLKNILDGLLAKQKIEDEKKDCIYKS